MVKLPKTALAEGMTIKSRADWRTGTPIHSQLDRECYSKCYICEDKPKSGQLTVDHIKPRQTHPALEFVWENLLLACSHCNGVKDSGYGNIINPTERDPEAEIAFDLDAVINRVNITAIGADSAASDTVALLNAVYNGDNADQGYKLGCAKLRKKLLAEIRIFELYLAHADEPDYRAIIHENIYRSSPFAAFKRRIVREDSDLRAKFGECL
jgi:uncharacterized protein (TIGR02646 family)